MVSNKGFNDGFITLYTNGVKAGGIVKIGAANTCAECVDGDKPVGILVNERNGIGSVQVCGYAKLAYSGTEPALGINYIAADGNGGIKADASGRAVIVLAVDTADQMVEVIF